VWATPSPSADIRSQIEARLGEILTSLGIVQQPPAAAASPIISPSPSYLHQAAPGSDYSERVSAYDGAGNGNGILQTASRPQQGFIASLLESLSDSNEGSTPPGSNSGNASYYDVSPSISAVEEQQGVDTPTPHPAAGGNADETSSKADMASNSFAPFGSGQNLNSLGVSWAQLMMKLCWHGCETCTFTIRCS
jgi:hypothetical protein